MPPEGKLFDIQHFAVHDGPGIRTLVFFKGCPLQCQWCCNPESISRKTQLKFIEFRCKQCYTCIKTCEHGAITCNPDSSIKINFEICAVCEDRKCVETCNYSALLEIGKTFTVIQLVDDVYKDINFYRNSGGGVTLSGGEPLMQTGFLLEVLKECKQREIHTAVETSGFAATKNFEEIAEFVDLFLFDIKIINSEIHKQFTGVTNELIHENLKYLISQNKEIIVRIPLIPSITDTPENLNDMINFCKENQLKNINIEPYNSLGISKYSEIGLDYKLLNIKEYHFVEVEKILNLFLENGFNCEMA